MSRTILLVPSVWAGALILAVAGALGYFYIAKPDKAPASSIRVEMTAARLARGKYLYNLADCDGCHSLRDFSRFGGPVVETGRGEGNVFPKEMGLPGIVAAQNITPDPETGIGQWHDGEKIRAIREGISADGSPLLPLMPYQRFRYLADENVESLVAYLNTLPPVKHAVKKSEITFPISLFMRIEPHPAGRVPTPDRTNKVGYGEYLVKIGGCIDCHTQTAKGKPLPGRSLAGGERFAFRGMIVVSANITPDRQTGIGRWTEQDFLDRFYQYQEYAEKGSPHVGPEGFTVMPWLNFCQLRVEDLRAIYAFLRRQKPVYDAIDTHPVQVSGYLRQ